MRTPIVDFDASSALGIGARNVVQGFSIPFGMAGEIFAASFSSISILPSVHERRRSETSSRNNCSRLQRWKR